MFRSVAIGITITSIALIAAYFAAAFWWNLWMYHNWIGTPHVLHQLLPGVVDGEASYDASFLEMFVICGVLFAVIFGLGLLGYRRIGARA